MSKKIEDSQTVLEEKSLLVPSPEGLKEDVNYLKEWIAQEPDLPNISDEEWLTTFLCNNKFSLERTKRKLVNYYVYRSKYPNVLMRSRDPSSMEALQTMKAFRLGSLQRSSNFCNPPENKFKLIYIKFKFLMFMLRPRHSSLRKTGSKLIIHVWWQNTLNSGLKKWLT